MALSLDGPDCHSHDSFRQVAGSFDLTRRALDDAREIGLETQVNTTITRRNFHSIPRMAQLVESAGAAMWSVFFLVPVGRASTDDDLTAAEYEIVFEQLERLGWSAGFDIKTTEAPHYRRYLARNGGGAARRKRDNGIARQWNINDGRGMLFVSHTGEIYPSGFLPLTAGSVRSVPLAAAYRTDPLFVQLRDSDQLGGKCGICEYRNLCGGSRARSYAITGDPMAAEPRCVYEPPTPVPGVAA